MEDGRATVRRVRRFVREARLELERQDEELDAAAARCGLERPSSGGARTAPGDDAPAPASLSLHRVTLRG